MTPARDELAFPYENFMNPENEVPDLERAKNDSLIRFTGEGRNERIHYVTAGHSER